MQTVPMEHKPQGNTGAYVQSSKREPLNIFVINVLSDDGSSSNAQADRREDASSFADVFFMYSQVDMHRRAAFSKKAQV